MILRPRTLFGRTAATLALTMTVFLIVSMGAIVYFVMFPMAKRAADDFAAELVSAAQSLRQLPAERHPDLIEELFQDHGLIVGSALTPLTGKPVADPLLNIFRGSLARLSGEDLSLYAADYGSILWVDVPAGGEMFRIGFHRGRLGMNPPLALVLALGSGTLLILLASLVEVRRVTEPLDRFASAIRTLGHGGTPLPLPEEGPEEITTLAHAFNKMAADLRQLAENRTVMISGVSHDLRTPLTRLAIAVEMLDEDANPELIAGIRRDIDVMNRLIGQFLQFSEAADSSCPVQMDLWSIIEAIAMDLQRTGADVRLHRHDPACVYFGDPDALERIMLNLMKNAATYGKGAPIDVDLHCSEDTVTIDISDRGPGIPSGEVEAVFRPFYRVETERTASTGGSGLGLAISRQLASSNGWDIDLLPREAGGTIARLQLPPCQRRAIH